MSSLQPAGGASREATPWSFAGARRRVFDDPVLAPLVLQKELSVSTEEELLRVDGVDERKRLARRAAGEGWERLQVRAAIEERSESSLLGTQRSK